MSLERIDQATGYDLGRAVLRQEAETLVRLADALDAPFWEIARLIANSPGLVWVTAVGTSAAVGQRFAHVLTDCGARAMFLSPDQGLHGHLGALAAGEVLIAISRGGESAEVVQMAQIAGRRGLTTVAFTAAPEASLARSCAQRLMIPSPDEYELGGYCATASSLAAAAMCDALCAVVLQLTGYSRAAFQATHPGGAVGRASD